ncbi:MAG: helix-turn-helix transcriptional regulator [Lachnospiraceae bacterium]|nr:helix-turn-helix transcriptional regulator [Lachnospiraceae bacterium]
MIIYDPFWKTLEKSDKNWYILVNKYGVNPATLHRLKHNMPISTVTIDLLCSILNCKAADVIAYKPDKK